MASPFKFFRKYSSGIMIVMVILSMLLFTMDGLFSDPGQNLWLLGLLLGGAVFAVAGVGQGKWLQWGLGGAALGAVLGFILPSFVETGGLKTSLGVISNEEMYDLENRRAIANRFLMDATESAFGEGTARFAPLFGFGHSTNREDVVFGKMMRAEAERLGIEVDAPMVKEYLARCTSEKLTKSAYLDIRNGLSYEGRPLTEKFVNEIIGDEIKARMAWQMTRPRTTTLPPGPEVYWQYYRRLNVRQQLNVAALDVDDFVDQVEDPSDVDVNQLFTQFKTKFPNQDGPGTPGFRLPARVKMAYLELSSDAALSEIDEVTDADIETYYKENQESPLIRQPVLPDFEPTENMPADPAEGSSEATDEAPAPNAPAKDAPAKDAPAKDAPAKDAPAKDAPARDAPAKDAPARDAPAKDAPAKDAPAKDAPAKDAPAKDAPAKDAPAKDAPAKDAPAKDAPAKDAPVDEKPPVSESEATEEDGGCGPFTDESAAVENSADESVQDAESTLKAVATEESADGNATDEPNEAPEIPDTPMLQDVESTEPSEIQYEYRTLDDELKGQIKETIESERLRAYVQSKMAEASAEMDSLARERSQNRFSLIEQDPDKYDVSGDDLQLVFQELRDEMRPQEQELNGQLKAFAKKNGLAYAETPLVTFGELLEEEDYPIATASEPNANPMMAAQSLSVAQTVFQGFNYDEQNNDAQLFMPRLAQRTAQSLEGGQSNYAYWAIDFSPSHIPELDEDGVKEDVILAWKRSKARELVQKRGEQLADSVRTGLAKEGDDMQNMAAVLKDQTVDGSDDGAAIAIRVTEPFSWLKTSMSQNTFQQQASMSNIEFGDASGGVLRKVGEEFMAKVFEDMDNESVDVVPNMDRTKYYVVHVTNRFPTPELGEDGLLDRFVAEGQQFGFQRSPILSVMHRQLSDAPNVEWEKNVWRRYDVDPDTEADE